MNKNLKHSVRKDFVRGFSAAIKTGIVFLLLAIPALSQVPVLESLRETVYARWDFQKQFPLSQKLFTNLISDQDRAKLIEQLKVVRSSENAAPQTPTFADLWAEFTLGLALEKTKGGEGDLNLQTVTQMAKGNIGVNYELARTLVQANMYQCSRPFQMETQRSMLEKGYTKIPELAKLELFYARQAMDTGNFQVAHQHADFASRLDPFCPWAPFLMMEMELRGATFINKSIGDAWIHLLEILSLFRYYHTQSIFAINLLRGLRLGLGIFGGVLLLVLFGRYFTRIFHLTAERMPHDVDIWVRYLALALIPLSCAIGGLGYGAVALLLIMLLWKYASIDEKAFLKAILTGLAVIPLLLICEQSLGRYLDDTESINLYHEAYSRGYEAPLVARLDAFKPMKMEDSVYRDLAYSLAYRKQGDYVKAGEHAKTAVQLAPSNPLAILSHGNVFMMTYNFPEASAIYGQARTVAPDWVETWFNSSQAELYSNNSAQHKKFLDRAADEDGVAVIKFLKNNDENFPEYPPNRRVMDPMLPNGQAWTKAMNALLDFDFMGIRMRMGIYEIPGGWLISAVGLVSLLLFIRFRQYNQNIQGRDLFDCKICGRVMCRTCRKGVHCQTCFKTVSGIQDNRVKMEMVSRISNRSAVYAVRIASALNTLLPGSGYLYLGLGGMRFAWTFISSLLIGGLWQANHLLMEYPDFVLGPLKWILWLPVILLYGLFNFKMLRSPVELSKVVLVSSPHEKAAIR